MFIILILLPGSSFLNQLIDAFPPIQILHNILLVLEFVWQVGDIQEYIICKFTRRQYRWQYFSMPVPDKQVIPVRCLYWHPIPVRMSKKPCCIRPGYHNIVLNNDFRYLADQCNCWKTASDVLDLSCRLLNIVLLFFALSINFNIIAKKYHPTIEFYFITGSFSG